jgi:hypothetical protein
VGKPGNEGRDRSVAEKELLSHLTLLLAEVSGGGNAGKRY